MENVTLTSVLTVVGVVYPALLFLLPVQIANKISFGISILKTIVTTLETAKDTKPLLSIESDVKKQFYQKSKK